MAARRHSVATNHPGRDNPRFVLRQYGVRHDWGCALRAVVQGKIYFDRRTAIIGA